MSQIGDALDQSLHEAGGLVLSAAETSVKALTDTAAAFWSVLDAAAEKKLPTEYLSQGAIRAIQGKGQT